MLALIDYAIIALYIIATIFIGFYISRKASANMQAYFLGSNSLKWYWLGFSNSSGMFDISGTAFYVSLLFVYGIKSAWIPWLWPIWNQIVVMMFLAIWIRRSGALTGAEWIYFRFGNSKGAKLAHIMVVAFATIAVVFFIGYIFSGIGKFASSFFPTIDLQFSLGSWHISNEQSFALLVIGLTTLYSIKGGMYSVVATEVLQYIIMIACCILVAWFAISHTNVAAISNELTTSWKTLTPDMHLQPTWAHVPAIDKKIKQDGFSFFGAMLLLMFGKGIFASLAGPVPGFDMQRILSTKTNKDAALMSGFTSLVLYIPLYLLIAGFTLLGINHVKDRFSKPAYSTNNIIKYDYTNNKTIFTVAYNNTITPNTLIKIEGSNETFNIKHWHIDSTKNEITIELDTWLAIGSIPKKVDFYRDIDFEKMLSEVVSTQLPAGIKGLVIAGLLAAFMSTFSAFVNAAPAYLVNDLYKKYWRPNETEKHYVQKSYLVSVVMIIIGVLIGLQSQSLSVLTVWITSSLYGGYAASNFLKWVWWRFTGMGYFIGMVTGLLISTAFYFWKAFFADKDSSLYTFFNTGVGSLTMFFIMLVLIVLACVVGSLCSKPIDAQYIEHFYKTTKPWGWWKPVVRNIQVQQASFSPNKHLGKDIVNVLIGIIWQFSMIIMPMYLVFAQWQQLWVSLVIFALSTIFIYFNWYKKLDDE